MIRRMDKRHYRPVGVVIDTEGPEESNPFCSTCMAIGKLSKLKQRIYLDIKGKLLVPQPPDAENYLQCWKCGLTIATYEAQLLGKISAIPGVSPVDNPNDIKKTILGVDSRLTSRIKRLKRQREKHEDKEVQRELDAGNTVSQYKTTMPT